MIGEKYDVYFDIQIEDVLNSFGFISEGNYKVRGGGKYIEVECPMCHKPFHFSFTPSKNVGQCWVCGFAANGPQLLAIFLGYDSVREMYKDFRRDLSKARNWCNITSEYTPRKERTYTEPEEEMADLETRHAVYSALLDLLVLGKYEEELVGRRRIPTEIVQDYKFKAVPDFYSSIGICNILQERGYNLEKVPGFFKTKQGDWAFLTIPGFFAPYLDAHGRIQAMQIRVDDRFRADNPENKIGKWIWFSSHGKDGGASCGSPVHVAIPPGVDMSKIKRVYATEGGLKATKAAVYTNNVFLGIGGIVQSAKLPKVIKGLSSEIEEVLMAFDWDVDKDLNKNVRKHEAQSILTLRQHGFRAAALKWDNHGGEAKGIDDLMDFLSKITNGEFPLPRDVLAQAISLNQELDIEIKTVITTTASIKLKPLDRLAAGLNR